jgi:hypothetical protein
VVPHDARDYIHVPTHVTSYPIELIREILHAKGPSYVCDVLEIVGSYRGLPVAKR